MGTQTFTSSGNFTVPNRVWLLRIVRAWGAGAGGASAVSTSVAAAGGGGGEYSELVNIAVTPGQVIPVVVPAGGDVQTDGGNTTFNGTTVIAVGGKTATFNAQGAGGLAGTGGTGSTRYPGGAGGHTTGRGVTRGGGGGGSGGTASAGNAGATGITTGLGGVAVAGGSVGGNGASGSGELALATSGTTPGAGGGGGARDSVNPVQAASPGTRGELIIEWDEPPGARSLMGVGT